jgi:hypothetical protein
MIVIPVTLPYQSIISVKRVVFRLTWCRTGFVIARSHRLSGWRATRQRFGEFRATAPGALCRGLAEAL